MPHIHSIHSIESTLALFERHLLAADDDLDELDELDECMQPSNKRKARWLHQRIIWSDHVEQLLHENMFCIE